jgi:hypothetical protein
MNQVPLQHDERRRIPASTFMTHPCAAKIFDDRFFEVAVPRKPYYNPANLEKAGTGVKQKEFI